MEQVNTAYTIFTKNVSIPLSFFGHYCLIVDSSEIKIKLSGMIDRWDSWAARACVMLRALGLVLSHSFLT